MGGYFNGFVAASDLRYFFLREGDFYLLASCRGKLLAFWLSKRGGMHQIREASTGITQF
jgi:hypothetical protein